MTSTPASDPDTASDSGLKARVRRISGGAMIMLVVVLACAILAWHAWQRHADFKRQQQQLVKTSSRGAAREITLSLEELRRSLRLLEISQRQHIQALARDPDDFATFQALSNAVRRHFPDAFAVTIADRNGQELVDNFDGEILDICRGDIATFAHSGKSADVLIHPNPLGYHFDITVSTDLGGQQGVFFVSFHPDRISRLLRTNALDGYTTYLVKAGDARGLIELSGSGSRNQLERPFFLDDNERDRIVARIPVEETQWDLVLLRTPDNAASTISRPLKDAAISVALLLLLGAIAAWWVRHSQLQIAARDRQLSAQAQELAHSEQRLQLLHRTTSSPDMGLSAKIDSLLLMGLQEFGLDLGIVSRIENDHYEVLYAVSHGPEIRPGTVFRLGETYCRHMLESGDAVGVAHVADSHWQRHPCYRKYGLESYIGAPIIIDREVVGTLNFSSATPRAAAFTERDLDLMRIMARWVGMELERERAERRLRHSEGYLQSILDTVVDGIFTIDSKGLISTFNRAASNMFGYVSEQIVGREARVLIPDLNVQPDALSGADTPAPTRETRDTWAQHQDGSRFPVELTRDAMPSLEGLRYCIVVRDISERRAADERLRLNHRLLEAISAAQSRFIAEEGNARFLDAMLADLLQLSSSDEGFIAQVGHGDDGAPYLRTCATHGLPGPDANVYPGFEALCDTVLANGVLVMETRTQNNRLSGNAAPHEGKARLCAPITHGSQMVGVAGIACAADRYDAQLPAFIEPLLATCGNLMQAHRNDQQLRESMQMQAAILRNTRYMIIATTPEGVIVSFNQAAEQTLGYEADELIGKHTPAVFHDETEIRQRAVTLSQEVGQTIEPGFEVFVHKSRAGEAEERVWTYVRKNGSRLSVSLSVSALTDPNGQITGFLGVAKDITEQLGAERALRQSEARLAEAQRIAHLGSWEWNITTDETYWSDETFRIFGYEPRSFEPDFSRYASHIHTDDRQRVLDALTQSRSDNVPYECGYRIVTATGEERDLDDRGQIIADEHGNPTRMIGIVRDVTQQRKVDRMKSEFVSTVSHELRTPLTSIRGSLGLLNGRMGESLDDGARELVTIAQRNAERLLVLINDILDLSKIESGRLSFQLRDTELLPFLKQALSANQGYVDQHEVQLVLLEPDEPLWVRADPDRLMQVMSNLLSNAAKFSPPGARIEIRARRQGDRVRISVRDFGAGIPAEFRDRVFDRFSQADASDARQVGGTGLGLSISKAIVERHGGSIGFDTEMECGTTFYFDLLTAANPTATRLTTPEQIDFRGRVLVCEDDADTARIIGAMLREQGFEVDIAHGVAQTRALLDQHDYCALTLDIRLPDGNGLELFRELRNAPRTGTLPVIVVSAVADRARNELNGAAVGILDWLEKPIDPQRLVSALTRIDAAGRALRPRVLHVEDDDDISRFVRLLLEGHAEVVQASGVANARMALHHGHFDLVLLDLELADGSGLSLIDDIVAHTPNAPAIVFSASELDEKLHRHIQCAFVKARTSDKELRESLLAALAGCACAAGGAGLRQ